MKKILILYTSIGQGHKSIAENIGFYLEQAGFFVTLYDAHKVESGSLAKAGAKLYEFLIKQFPFVWKWLYDTRWFISLTLPYRIWVASRNCHKTLQAIHQLEPDAVISTQVTPSAVLAYLKRQGLYKGKFGIAFSDFHLHRYWLFDQADFYLANIPEQKEEMIKLAVQAEKIFVCGMTLKSKNQIDSLSIKRKFNIEPGDKVILFASGSMGTGIDGHLISEFISRPKIKVIAVCGKNKKLYENLSDRFAETNATILGYHAPMDELYAVADILITKPGGLSVAEALQWGLPILISHMLPGQERHNYDYLLEKGLVMPEPINLVSEVLEELQTGFFKKVLRANPELPGLFNRTEVLIQAVKSQLTY